jgi:hypothetical protein
MKTHVIVMLVCLVFVTVPFNSAFCEDVKYTTGGHPACRTREQLNMVVGFALQNDEAAMKKMISSGQCVQLRSGIPVYIMDSNFIGTEIKIRPKGATEGLWTVMEAVR